MYHHCAAHRLNLAIVSAFQISSFKNTESYIGEMATFFKYSAKWQRLLDKVIVWKKTELDCITYEFTFCVYVLRTFNWSVLGMRTSFFG